MYPNICRFQKNINLNTLKAIFGLGFSDSSGKAAYPPIQAAPALSSSFKHIFGNKNIPCLIPCGIDQDPYFRMTRDVCSKLKAPKPAGIYSKYTHYYSDSSLLYKDSAQRCQVLILSQESL